MKIHAGLVLPAILLAVLGGCAAVGPDYAEPALPVPANWSNAPAQAAAAQDLGHDGRDIDLTIRRS